MCDVPGDADGEDAGPGPIPLNYADTTTGRITIVVSHRALRKVSGPLHDQTALGDTGEEVVEKGVTYRFYVTRKAVEQLSKEKIGLIERQGGSTAVDRLVS